MQLTIVPDYPTAYRLGATGPNGRPTMPDGSRAMSVRSLRGGAVRGHAVTGYTVAPGVELTEDDRDQLDVAMLTSRHQATPDPVDVFAQLVREVDAGRALIAMTDPGARRRAATASLALARDVLEDARGMLELASLEGRAMSSTGHDMHAKCSDTYGWCSLCLEEPTC